MKLTVFAAAKKQAIFAELQQGLPPSVGTFDEAAFRDGKAKSKPQMGAVRYEPHAIFLEFIYPDPQGSSVILTVRLDSPERIVFLPVPEWVVESIWQGDIDGSYHFESDASALFESFQTELNPDNNSKWFGPRVAKRRE